jgi:putative FmdB family regulatory protein
MRCFANELPFVQVSFLSKLPVFEFRCQSCAKKFSELVGMVATETEAIRCPSCGSFEVKKLVSRFVRGKTEDDRIDEVADRLENLGEDVSSSELRSTLRELGQASDEEMGDELEEMFEADMEGKIEDDE